MAAIRDTVRQAQTIVFLGFAFHQLNMDLLNTGAEAGAKRVFATTYRISDSDTRHVKDRIISSIPSNAVDYFSAVECAAFMDEHQLGLSLV